MRQQHGCVKKALIESARAAACHGNSLAAATQRLLRLAVVLGVGYVRSPVGLRLLTVAYAFGDGEVGHEVVGGGAMPVLLVGGCVDDVAGSDLDDVAAPGPSQPGAFGDVEGLAEGVGVPGAAGPGAEADQVDAGAKASTGVVPPPAEPD